METVPLKVVETYFIGPVADIRKLHDELRKKDEESKRKYYSDRRKTFPTEYLKRLRMAGTHGYIQAFHGSNPDIKYLEQKGLLEELGRSVEITDPGEMSEEVFLYRLTHTGQDVHRYHLFLEERDRDDAQALKNLGAKGRRALYKMRETGLYPTAQSTLELLFNNGMIERTGRGGKILSARRAKQLRYEPLDPKKVRTTDRYHRCVDRVTKNGSYRRLDLGA